MDIGIFTICYNGYGRFAPQWCRSIARLTRKPKMAVIAIFGDSHGLTDKIQTECREILHDIQFKIVHKGEHTTLGMDRNKAVEETTTEWIMLLSIDDIVLPIAIEEYEKYDRHDIDVIACPHFTIDLAGGEPILHKAPKDFSMNAMLDWRHYWLSPYSPFRRSFWEKHPYFDGELPNAQQTNSFAVHGARFARTDIPCVNWIKRKESHHTRIRKTEEDQKLIDQFLDDRVKEITN